MGDNSQRLTASHEEVMRFQYYILDLYGPCMRVFGCAPLEGVVTLFVVDAWVKYGADHDPDCEAPPCTCYRANGYPADLFLMGTKRHRERRYVRTIAKNYRKYRRSERQIK